MICYIIFASVMNDAGLMSRELFSVLATMDTLKDRWLWYHYQVKVIGACPNDKLRILVYA